MFPFAILFFWEKIDSNENSKPNRRPRKTILCLFLSLSRFLFTLSQLQFLRVFVLKYSLALSLVLFSPIPRSAETNSFNKVSRQNFLNRWFAVDRFRVKTQTSLARRFEVKKCTKYEKNKGFLAHVAKHGRVKRTSRERNQTPLKN